MAKGEFVPTRQSPNLDSMYGRSSIRRAVASCWYVFDMPRIMVDATLIRNFRAYAVVRTK